MGLALTCGCGGYARSCRRLPVRFAPKGFGRYAPPMPPIPSSPLLWAARVSRWGARLTLSDGAGLRADLRLRRLRALLPQATLQVRPQGASGANAPPASLLPLSLGGCTVVHPYKRLITIEISTFVVMLSRFLLGLLPRSSRHGDVHPARSAQSRVAAHLFGSHGQERA